ncbi:hypothetical protein ACF0H5_017924 [Mactra antiquata]
MTNRAYRGSFYARRYGGGLRSANGSAWSPMVFSKVTGKTTDNVFLETYRTRCKQYITTLKHQRKTSTKILRSKRKLLASKSCEKQSRKDYGPNVLNDVPDLSECNLKKECDQYYRETIVVNEYKGKAIDWKPEARVSMKNGNKKERNA